MTEYTTAAEAARRLGVKPATLYAYVSRGVLNRDKAADGRGSLFDAEEVERLAPRGRPRTPRPPPRRPVQAAHHEDRRRRANLPGLGRRPRAPQPQLRGRSRAALDR